MRKNKGIFYGSKLKLARNLQGFTLGQIGESISVSRQYLQKLESDPDIFPNEDMVAALSVVLSVEPDFFYSPITSEVPDEICHFRKRKTAILRLQKKALAFGTIFSWIVSYFDSVLLLPKDVISGSNLGKMNNFELAAEKVRLDWGLSADAPIDNVIRAVENSGAIVTTFEGVSKEIDAFSYFSSRPIIVRNNAKESTSRARFDVAHELGHLMLHGDIDADNPELEDEANRFAIAFLLPKNQFTKEFPNNSRMNWRELCELKIRWRVSLQAIIRRAYDLRLIDSVAYRNAYVYINKKGWKTEEPCEHDIPNENPEVVPASIHLLGKKGINPSDIARQFGIKPCILSNLGIEFKGGAYNQVESNVINFERAKKKPQFTEY